MTGVLGAVLTGGRSSRFGSDKGSALFGGTTLADHAAAAIAPFVDEVVRVGGTDGIADLPAPGLGPLGGIAAALDHAATRGFDAVLTTGCDMPSVPDGLVEALLRRAPAYCTDAPVLGHWPTSALRGLLDLLSACDAGVGKNGPAIRGWARSIGAIPVASPAPLANVNTPEDLLAL